MDEGFDYYIEDFDDKARELNSLYQDGAINIDVDSELEQSIQELNALKDEYSKEDAATLLELCGNTVIDTVTQQFGLLSVLVNSQDGGNVTTVHNFKGGVTATGEDAAKYQDWQNVMHGGYKEVRKSGIYDKQKNKMRQECKEGSRTVKDEYTGRTILTKNADVDHIVSAKEIEKDAGTHLAMTREERASVAQGDENLAWTSDKINRSKGSKSMEGFLDKVSKKDGKRNAERFKIDEAKARRLDKNARRYVYSHINKATAQKYTQELLCTGAKDAAMAAGFTAIGIVMRDLVQGIIIELRVTFDKRGKESFGEILRRFKSRLGVMLAELKEKWRDIFDMSLWQGVMAFLSNIVVFVINLFFTTLKKIVMMIRAGFVSLCNAVKMLAHPTEGMTKEDAQFEAAKIFITGMITAASFGLSAVIEKGLQAIPGLQPLMMFPIPSIRKEQRTVSDAIAITLSALAGGLISTVVLYFMDKCRNTTLRDKLQVRLVVQSGVVVHCQIAQTWTCLSSGYEFLRRAIEDEIKMLQETKNRLDKSFAAVAVANDRREAAMNALCARLNQLNQ